LKLKTNVYLTVRLLSLFCMPAEHNMNRCRLANLFKKHARRT